MCRTFQRFQQLLYVVIGQPGRETQLARNNLEGFAGRLAADRQAKTKKVVYGLFEGRAGPPRLLFKQMGHIRIERESGAHIKMLYKETS